MGRRPQLAAIAALARDLRGLRPAALSRRQAQPRDGGNRRQRLAPEAERDDTLEIIERADLARGVTLERDCQLLTRNPAAIIAHANEAGAAALHLDLDARRASVEAVLDQLLHDRGRTLDDLARGDLVDQVVRQDANRAGDVRRLRRT